MVNVRLVEEVIVTKATDMSSVDDCPLGHLISMSKVEMKIRTGSLKLSFSIKCCLFCFVFFSSTMKLLMYMGQDCMCLLGFSLCSKL